MIETLRLARRTPGCLLLLLGNFAIAVGSNIVLPYLAVYLTQELALSPLVVATAITVRFWSQQGLAVVGGWIADRVGPVKAMCGGLVIRAVSYLLLLAAASPLPVVAACALLGFGGAMYVPASKLALVQLIGSGNQLTMVFALRSTANNVGAAIGPLVGTLLLLADPRVGFLVTSTIYVVLAVSLLRLRSLTYAQAAKTPTVVSDSDEAVSQVRRRDLAWVLACAFAFGFCYIQLEYALPVFASSLQSPLLVGVLFTLNAVAVVLLQLPLNTLSTRLESSALVISGALMIMATSFAAASLGSVAGLIACVLLFSAAEVLIDPRIDNEVAQRVPARWRGLAFGLVGTAIASGAACANGLAVLLASGADAPARQFWLILVAISASFAVILYVAALMLRPKRMLIAAAD